MNSDMKAKLFCGVLYADVALYGRTAQELISKFGEIEIVSEEYDFDFTGYYLGEFGPNLKKRFIVFMDLVHRKDLAKLKLITCKIEKSLSKENRREVNIDPGYITKDNVVVASTKEMPHRVYLDKGIFADIQMVLTKNKAFFYRHTFRDYESQSGFFLEQRRRLMQE
jgi:hypothetical protein